jgi:AcrR family transcriptional regulator
VRLSAGPPATRRGRYDRAASASERARAQRDLLLGAGFALLSQRNAQPLAVAELTRQSGSSKNTFYSHFDSLEDFVAVLSKSGTARLREALDLEAESQLTTPVQGIRDACDSWVRVTSEHLGALRAALIADPESVRALVRDLLQPAVLVASRAGLFPSAVDPLKWRCVEACFLEVPERATRNDSGAAAVLAEIVVSVIR